MALMNSFPPAEGLCVPLRGGSLRDRALKFGVEIEDDFEEMAKAWEKWVDIEDASLAMVNGEILVEK